MPYIAYLPNSRVTLLDLDEVAEVLNVSRKTASPMANSAKKTGKTDKNGLYKRAWI